MNLNNSFDRYLEKETNTYMGTKEAQIVTACEKCECDLYDCDEAYLIDGCYYCEDCIRNFKVNLHDIKEEQENSEEWEMSI